jgi:hypothetical protein
LVRNSPALRAYQREILARFEQAAALADETGAPRTPSSRSSPAAGLVSVFRVNLKGRDSDTEPPGQRAERALDLLEHGLGDYAVSPAPPPAPQSGNAGSAHHGRTVTRQSAAHSGGTECSRSRRVGHIS